MIGRGFCPNRGCPIHSKNSAMPDMVFPRASSLDDPSITEPTMVVHASRAIAWDHATQALPKFEGMPQGGPEQVIADPG
jgi:hypothetical protein